MDQHTVFTTPPDSFETLEEISAPFHLGFMILLRGGISRVDPGDYAYTVANIQGARSLDWSA